METLSWRSSQGHAQGSRAIIRTIVNQARKPVMPDTMTTRSLLDAVERYFDLMFDGDVERFDQVFAGSAQLHGLRDGNLLLRSAKDYKTALASDPSPKAKSHPGVRRYCCSISLRPPKRSSKSVFASIPCNTLIICRTTASTALGSSQPSHSMSSKDTNRQRDLDCHLRNWPLGARANTHRHRIVKRIGASPLLRRGLGVAIRPICQSDCRSGA